MLRRRPVVVRQGPGLLGTVARTAVVAGTATATSRAINSSMTDAQMQKQQNQAARNAGQQTQAELEQVKSQMATLQAQQVQRSVAAAPDKPDILAQLQQLAQLKQSGMLTEDEFQAAKGKLLI